MNIFDENINILCCMFHVIKFYTSHRVQNTVSSRWVMYSVYAYIYLKVLYKYFLVTYILLNLNIVNYKAMNTSYTYRRPDFINLHYDIYIYIYIYIYTNRSRQIRAINKFNDLNVWSHLRLKIKQSYSWPKQS